MSKPYRDFEPNWFRGDYSPKSYRSIFKWGGPDQIKPPKETLYKMIKETFGLTDADFDHYTEDLGLDEVQFDAPIALSEAQLDALFAGEVLDVSSDIAVLDGMLSGDGLSGKNNLKLS